MKKSVFVMSFLFLFSCIGHADELIIKGNLANKADKQVRAYYSNQQKDIDVSPNGYFEFKPNSVFKNLKGNEPIILEFNNVNFAKESFKKGEKVSINNPIRVILYIDNNKITNRIDEYLIVGVSTDMDTLAPYPTKVNESNIINAPISSFSSQSNKEKFEAEERSKMAKAAEEQREIMRINDFNRLVAENPTDPKIAYKDFTPEDIFTAFSAVADPIKSVLNISGSTDGKHVYFEAIQIFQKRGNDFLFNLNNIIFYGILSPDCKRGAYKERQIVKICGVISGETSYPTIMGNNKTIPKVIIYSISPY
ncbi:MAG: hypothetical protein LBV16_09700 [Elusimicrobiota bacterium]|jgi:hypothetical protein|nr:hypothetical protein [Elusimicrobiota bacterium]